MTYRRYTFVRTLIAFVAANVAPIPAQTVPFQLTSNKIYVPATVNGRGPYSFILDTGAVEIVVDHERAASLNINGTGHFEAHGAGDGALSGSTAHGVEVAVANARLPRRDAEVLPINQAVSASEGRTVDGLLGRPFFEHFIVDIDYGHGQVSFFAPENVRSGNGESLPIEIQRGNIFASATVVLPGGERVAGRFLVDTGWRSAVSLSTSFVREHRLEQRIRAIIATSGVGIGGRVTSSIGRLEAVQLGSYEVNRPIVDFAISGGGVLSNDAFAGIIGAEILRRFHLVIDYPHRRLFLRPNEATGEPVEFDMSGMYVTASGPDFRTFQILSVTADSPAAEAGLRQGETIETIDDQPATHFSLEQLRQILKREGNTVSLGVRDASAVRLVRLKLRRLI